MNQYERISTYMDDFGSISPMEAFTELGITKLATRIGEMIRNGYRIEKIPESRLNRYGQVTRYTRYRKAA